MPEAGAAHDPDASGDFHGRILGVVGRKNALEKGPLDIARLDSGAVPLQIVDGRPHDLVPAAAFDPARLEQVVVNLVRNAVKFALTGGSVAPSSRARRAAWSRSRSAAQ